MPALKWIVRIQPNMKWDAASPPTDGGGEPMKYPVMARTMMQSIVVQCQMRVAAS